MMALLWLLPISAALAAGGLALFLWCARSGQFEDLDGAAWRILNDDETGPRSVRRHARDRDA